MRQILGLGHTTDVQEVDRRDCFVYRFLGCRERFERSDVLLLPLHEFEDVLGVELADFLDVTDELVLCLGERILELGNLLEDLLLKRALAQLQLVKDHVQLAARVCDVALVQVHFGRLVN